MLTGDQSASEPRRAPEPAPQPAAGRGRKVVIAALFVAYFFLISWDTVKAHFAPDDMMAIWWYWHPPPIRLLISQFMLWHGYLRPVAAAFYVPLYLAFGLDPVPYHVVLLLLLLVGAYLMYRLARALGCGELPSAIVAVIGCYHGGLSNLYYNTVFVFDVLCGIFFFAAFTYYARIRSSGSLLNRRQTLAFLGLYLCALNAKEMAVTLPVLLLAYEWLFYEPPRLPLKSLVRWLRGPGQVLTWAALMNVVFIYGKRFGAEGLMNSGTNYMPVLSLDRIVDFHERYLGDIFYHLPRFELWPTLLIGLVITYLAWRRKRPLLRFCWFWIVLTPLPIEFLVGRDQACLYVPLGGWAVFAAAVFTDWLPGATRILSGEPLFRLLKPAHVRAMLAAAGMLAYAFIGWRFKTTEVVPVIPELGRQTANVLAEFRAVQPRVPPASNVVFLDDGWPDSGFDMVFIAELWFRDRKTHVLLKDKSRLSPERIVSADAVFTWRDGRLIRVR
jgi:hypothetical protein